ncbi:MAG: hypothetical protein E4H44_03290 [Candidatus Aminicenantes bacterium]|nr:MAG: hypothetical protein E4H44_03290 [Candidatus Aminicenantes bacterium]
MSHSVDETYVIYDETWRKARKQHRCDACNEPISVGHQYARVFILFDGEKSNRKRCARCQRIHEHLRTVDKYGDTWPDENLACGQSYEDEWGECPPEIAALAFALPGEVDKPT